MPQATLVKLTVSTPGSTRLATPRYLLPSRLREGPGEGGPERRDLSATGIAANPSSLDSRSQVVTFGVCAGPYDVSARASVIALCRIMSR